VGSRPYAPPLAGAIAAGVKEAERTTFTRRAGWRAVAALGYLGFDIAVLWIALRALGRPPGVPALVMGYSIGYGATSLPAPGGIGVLDAGLTGALVLYGVAPAHAAAAALIYHAIAFWVPGLGGLYAYVRLRPRLLAPADGEARLAWRVSPAPSSTEARAERSGRHAQGGDDRVDPVPRPSGVPSQPEGMVWPWAITSCCSSS
jgi:Lysylphosphatidylglycerol synthase TM region